MCVKIGRQTVEKSARLWYYATNQKARFVVMLSIVLGAGLFGLAILFQLAGLLRLGVPLAYALIVPTLFHRWYYAHYALANGIWYAMLLLAVLSWLVTIVRRIRA
jgi:hypothetical protein